MSDKETFISRHFGSIIIAVATIIAAIIGGFFLLQTVGNKTYNPSVSVGKSNLDKNKKDDTDSNQENSPLSARDVLSTLHDKNLTDLQINQFIKRNSGISVRWEVIVDDVRPAFPSMDKSDLYLVFHPKYKLGDSFQNIIVARFTYDKEAELSSLSEGDLAIIEGELDFYHLASWTVSLGNAKLIKFTKK